MGRMSSKGRNKRNLWRFSRRLFVLFSKGDLQRTAVWTLWGHVTWTAIEEVGSHREMRVFSVHRAASRSGGSRLRVWLVLLVYFFSQILLLSRLSPPSFVWSMSKNQTCGKGRKSALIWWETIRSDVFPCCSHPLMVHIRVKESEGSVFLQCNFCPQSKLKMGHIIHPDGVRTSIYLVFISFEWPPAL